MRRSRRSDRATTGRRPDLRRLLRDQVGERTRPARLSWRRPRRKPRPRVLILDVSGSMAAYSRMLLQLAWSTRRSGGPVEVFCFGTRLTRVTGAIAHRDPDDALTRAAGEVVDWDGGTRIGESIRSYLHDHARRAGCRGGVVILCSDGLERGEPALLAAQLARLQRLSHRVVWVNPLAGGAGFEPTARGMAAALPHVDVLVAGHSLASLEHLSRVVSEVV
ncbi:MAG TPA: VWA domain-containing protein [Mycobacteriales bacterium]|nr:VWA domain-containing protein [Mycobacteriales bacterium]